MCTSIYQVTLDHTHLLARTMDWPILAVSPLFVPRQFKWATAFDHRIYTNKYAMVGGEAFLQPGLTYQMGLMSMD